jgi:hypothetical protein
MSGTTFTITQYGQDRLVMDYFAMQDPFQQVVPIKITNNWSGGLYFVGALNSPPAWYSAYSGVAFSGSNAGAVPLAAGSSDTYTMTWTISASGSAFYTSSPNLDTLTLGVVAYASGFLSGTIASGQITIKNLLFNRYSGVIKVFGDQYSNDQPTPTVTQVSGTALGSGSYSYAISYFLSGWESDISAPATFSINSGFANASLSWTGVAGVTQYAVWRWSGTTDFSLTSNSSFLSGAMDLIALISGTSITDSGISAIQTGMLRHRTWADSDTDLTTTAAGTFLSPPQSRMAPSIGINPAPGFVFHGYQVGKNISGNTLLGPWYVIQHVKASTFYGLGLGQARNFATSGSVIADNPVFSRVATALWNRFGLYVSGGSATFATNSGLVAVQWFLPSNRLSLTWNFDDVFVVANS